MTTRLVTVRANLLPKGTRVMGNTVDEVVVKPTPATRAPVS
jgi:hypothetical protein